MTMFGVFATSVVSAQSASGAGEGAAPADPALPPPPPGGYPPPPPGGYPPPPPGYYGPQAPTERTANNSIYIEGLGPGILYSLNYDRNFGDFAGRVGFSYLGVSARAGSSESHASLITVPLTVTYLGIGSKKNMFEMGGGVTIVHASAGANSFAFSDSKTNDTATLLLGNLVFGYRLQPPDGGFMLRVGLSPIFGAGAFIPLPYLALGGTF
ncbi:MAG: hypothetical protein ABUL62_11245 [Myxococcales bacterium]